MEYEVSVSGLTSEGIDRVLSIAHTLGLQVSGLMKPATQNLQRCRQGANIVTRCGVFLLLVEPLDTSPNKPATPKGSPQKL